MNSPSSAGHNINPTEAASGMQAMAAALQPALRQPWLLCALVLLVALMSSYVHVLNGQVERGERLRAQGFAQTGKSGPTPWLAHASAQPVPAVGMDTGR